MRLDSQDGGEHQTPGEDTWKGLAFGSWKL